MSETHCGYVAILGAPNAGKSTLLNQMVGGKIAIVSPKVQTTRNRITGVCTDGKAQIVFLDTPGIYNPTHKFEKAMVASAWSGAADADIVMLLIDADARLKDEIKDIIEKLAKTKKRLVLVLNKIDAVAKEALLALTQQIHGLAAFEKVFMISALKGDGVQDLKQWLGENLPIGPWLFPEDEMTDITERLLATEITREKCFFNLKQELPYSIAVDTEKWEEKKDGSVAIHQVIYIQREGQKKIVLGEKGAMLKAIGSASRKELEYLWQRKVHLFLHVKVKTDWKDTPEVYKALGLEF